jgi:MFS family permease
VAGLGVVRAVLGGMGGGWGVGAVLGAVIAFRIGARFDRYLVASLGEVAMVAPLWFLLADVPSLTLIAAMTASGLANGLVNAPVHTIFLLRTPRALRAKVWSVVIVLTSVLGPAALGAAGPALEWVGFRPVLLVVVVVQTLAALAFAAAGLRERAHGGPTAAPALEEHA